MVAAAVMVLIAGYCLVRLGLGVRSGLGADRLGHVSQLAMAVAMAGMLDPVAALPVPVTAWWAGFATLLVATLFTAARSPRDGDHAIRVVVGHLQHVTGLAAMLLMLSVPMGDTTHPMAGHVMRPSFAGAGGLALLVGAGLLTPALLLSAIVATRAGVEAARRWRQDTRGRSWVVAVCAPLWSHCCEAVMAGVMAAMVVALLV